MYITSVEQEATPTEDSIPEAEMNEFEREEDRQFKQQWAKLRPVKTRLAGMPVQSTGRSGGESPS